MVNRLDSSTALEASRQGCPFSPCCIVMEFISAILYNCPKSGLIPTPFSKCNTSISHLFFADDVMLFALADIPLVGGIKSMLKGFQVHSGLSVTWSKSFIIFCNCEERKMDAICSTILNSRGEAFQVKYLGLPLFSTRLKI